MKSGSIYRCQHDLTCGMTDLIKKGEIVVFIGTKKIGAERACFFVAPAGVRRRLTINVKTFITPYFSEIEQ